MVSEPRTADTPSTAVPCIRQDGFEICRGVFTAEEIASLRTEADRISREAGSACVRNPRSRSAMFAALSESPKLMALLPSGLSTVRSILFDKTEAANWPVAWHQDLTIAVAEEVPCESYGPWSVKDGIPHVQPPVTLLESMVTARIHLDPTGADNGALIVAPRSHRNGKLDSNSITSLTDGGAVICECRPGDVLIMSPLILHSSKRSRRPDHRRILHFEYAPPDALDYRLSWHESSAKAPTSLPRFP